MNQYFATPFSRFRTIAILEGISFLILLFIAMPLKYLADMPKAVKMAGSLHGLLFVLFIVFLYEVKDKENWSFGKTGMAFLASVIPFGTFWFDKKLAKEST